MTDVLDKQTLALNAPRREAKTSTVVSTVVATAIVAVSSGVAGAGIGLGWRIDSLAFLGILGFGIFLTAQLSLKSFWACVFQATITGYLAYLVANPWMTWTIEGLMSDTPAKVPVVGHGIHLLHGGMYCLFAALWWMSRKWLHGGLFAAPALWLILESIYPAMFPMRQGCLIAQVTPLI